MGPGDLLEYCLLETAFFSIFDLLEIGIFARNSEMLENCGQNRKSLPGTKYVYHIFL